MKINVLKTPIFYINLSKDTHNKTAIQEELSNAGFSDINRVEGIEESSGKLGCSKSHKLAFDTVQANSLEDSPYIVLEDDARILNFVSEIEIPNDADAVYLGTSKYGLYGGRGTRRISAERVDQDVFRIYNMLASHAILYINKEYANFISDKISFFFETGDDHDKLRAETMKYFKIYALDKPMFYQYGEHQNVTSSSIAEIGWVNKEWSH